MITTQDELQIPALGLWLDARRPRDLSFISHAHSDHVGSHARAIVTRETAELCRERFSSKSDVDYEVHELGETFTVGEATCELLSAGHILGSSQLFLNHDGQTLLYTGDFKLRSGHTHPRCQTRNCDILVMECTYGRPRYRFPDRAEVEAELIARCAAALEQGQTPVVYAYALGKAQEIIAALNRAGLALQLHGIIARICEAYERLGIDLGPWKRYERGTTKGHVLIVPPDARRTPMIHSLFPRFDIAVTGWAIDAGTKFRMGVDLALPYSDHADFPELMEYVERTEPARVYCTHGFPDFVHYLRREGVNASWLSATEQLELFR